MNSIEVNIKGFDELTKRLSSMKDKLATDVDDILNVNAQHIATEAKILAPVDEGNLQGSISADTSRPLDKSIAVNAFYAAFVEFGTGKYAAQYVASLPDDWRTFAASFRGQKGGGTFHQFVLAMKEWLLRHGASKKGIDQHAYAVARKKLRDGIKPQPFLVPPFENQKPIILKNIETLLNEL